MEQQLEIASALSAMLGCEAPVAQVASRLFRRKRIGRAETLSVQGATCERCWLLVDGLLALRAVGSGGQLIQVATVAPGEFVGAFPNARQQPAELIAIIRSEVLEASAAALGACAREEPAVGAGLARLLAHQQDKLIASMTRQFVLTAAGRVFAELLNLADDEGFIRPAPIIAAIALRANTSRETASRAVTAAERRGIIERDERTFRIASRQRLEMLII